MAYEQQFYRTTRQSVMGLSSSHSCLDGVPFKISPSFIPPAQPALPTELLHAATNQVLNEEYEYDTEEAVLAWSRAREEAKAKVIADREASERARAAVAAAESSSSDSDEDTADDSMPLPAPNMSVEVQPAQPQTVKPPWQLQIGASASGTILTPIPIQASKKKAQSPMAAKAPVDLALFEQEGDPFDNMELQTIDDMEELRTVLGGATLEGGSQEQSPHRDNQAVKDASQTMNSDSELCQSSEEESVVKSFVASSANNLYVNVVPGPSGMTVSVDEEALMNSSLSTSVSKASGIVSKPELPSSTTSSFVIEPTNDGDYVQIRSDYSQMSVSFKEETTPIYCNIDEGAEEMVEDEETEQYSNATVFKTALPPIRPRGKSLGSESSLEVAAERSSSTAVSSPAHPRHRQANMGFAAGRMTQSAYIMSSSASGVLDGSGSDISSLDQHHTYSNVPRYRPRPAAVAASPAFSNHIYSRYENIGPGSHAPVNGVGSGRDVLRNAKSNPDLSLTDHSLRHGSSQCSSSQPWNPYKPLPPTPVSDLRSSSSSTESLPTDQCLSPEACIPGSVSNDNPTGSTSQPDYDPYHSLSNEAKTFVNNLTSMGFSRSRASRAVEKFGADEREVLDHLFNVDKLVEKKFTPALAETGLQLFKNNLEKAEQFLDLYQQFMELGFTSDRIQTALVKHELDRDKALDYLTT